MDRLRVKHVVNELVADLTEGAKTLPTPDDYAWLVRRFCKQVAALLIWGLEAYKLLELGPPYHYDTMSRPADLVFHAVLRAANTWNWDMEGRANPVKVFMDAFSLAMFVADRMKTYDMYFEDHPEKVEAYDRKYTTITALIDAHVDVEAMGEPYEMAPLPLSNGRIGCLYCDLTMKDMIVLATHHETVHQSHGRVACTDCTWTSVDGPGILDDHQQTVHDIYPADHPHFFSSDLKHLRTKSKEALKQLLIDDVATRAALRNQPAPPGDPPAEWGLIEISRALYIVRSDIKTISGWEREVDQARVRRITQP